MTEHVTRVRWYQRPLHEYLTQGGKRAIAIWHRRAGKDEIALAATRQLALQRPGSYWHCLPEYEQGRRALWEAVNAHTGRNRVDEAFPPSIVKRKDSQRMFLELANGSTWQIIGSDRFDSTVGAGVAGIVYSEWALANPSAWGYHRPMVEENNGWAAFITTPRGNNHAKAMYDMARGLPDRWFSELLGVNETGALSRDQLDEALAEYIALFGEDMGRAQFEQEYYCSFNAAILGAYFGREMSRAEADGRVRVCEIDHSHPVHTAWDLGKAANNPIWCFQVIGGQLRIVDFYQPQSDDLEDWVRWLNDKGYTGDDYVPHDILVSEWGSKRTRYDTLRNMGRKPKRIIRVSVADGLQAGRASINAAVFHGGGDERAERVALGIEGLKNYRREWDDERKTFRETPVKDWAEHIGSAFRYLGLAWRDVAPPKPKVEKPRELVFTARPDGSVVSNMSVREAVKAMKRRRQND